MATQGVPMAGALAWHWLAKLSPRTCATRTMVKRALIGVRFFIWISFSISVRAEFSIFLSIGAAQTRSVTEGLAVARSESGISSSAELQEDSRLKKFKVQI
jgi:hypothetical protein